MFNPSREQVRQFFTEAWHKRLQTLPLTPLEVMATDLIAEHPEYHELLADPDATQGDYPVAEGRTNPFLHLSMHLAIQEQISVDQPPGIRAAYQRLLATRSAHDATHCLMEALGEMMWEAQRLGKALDNERYLTLIRKHAGL